MLHGTVRPNKKQKGKSLEAESAEYINQIPLPTRFWRFWGGAAEGKRCPRAAARLEAQGAPQLPLGGESNELDRCPQAASTLPSLPSGASARPPPPPTTVAARRVESRNPQGPRPALFSREGGRLAPDP
ncbi:hypothetical protein J1605_005179 [Eschrichtius robustus]|uniref:Uncharacterized protein n=1 Tax=Eschrichtius robustus TaxID=9764 RepID=A0AB34H9N9_ESCRO|nr:hypothetical protein J1605_005179 [Eschrichtius robustus]